MQNAMEIGLKIHCLFGSDTVVLNYMVFLAGKFSLAIAQILEIYIYINIVFE